MKKGTWKKGEKKSKKTCRLPAGAEFQVFWKTVRNQIQHNRGLVRGRPSMTQYDQKRTQRTQRPSRDGKCIYQFLIWFISMGSWDFWQIQNWNQLGFTCQWPYTKPTTTRHYTLRTAPCTLQLWPIRSTGTSTSLHVLLCQKYDRGVQKWGVFFLFLFLFLAYTGMEFQISV